MSALITLKPRLLTPRKRQPVSSLVALHLDGTRLEVVAARRTNGSLDVKTSFITDLSLDPLKDDPQLVGREIRKQLQAHNIRERHCVVGLPLSWALTLSLELPELSETDLESFLHIEAERGFPYSPDNLMLAHSRYHTASGQLYATLVAIPKDHVSRLETALKAAQLRPASFSLGIVALSQTGSDADRNTLTLLPGEQSVGCQVSSETGVALLRSIEGAYQLEGGGKQLQTEHVTRELRITLGQLPPNLRESLRSVLLFGQGNVAEELAEVLQPVVRSLGMTFTHTQDCPSSLFGLRIHSRIPISPALCLAAQHLARQPAQLEFLPPKVTAWQQFTHRYSSRKLAWTGAALGIVAGSVLLAWLFQQWQLSRWQSKWNQINARVAEVESLQQNIKTFRPWYDESFRSLGMLRRLTEAFPVEATVSAKTIEIRQPATVTCSGIAHDRQALLQTLDKLRETKEVAAVQIEQVRGESPLQFTFNFQWLGSAFPQP